MPCLIIWGSKTLFTRAILTRSDLPKLIGIVMCERVLLDVIRRESISCINIHNGIVVQAFPTVIQLIYAFAQLSGSHHAFSYQFKIVDRQNQIIAMSPVAQVDPLPNRNMTHKIISAFSGLTFNEEGMYNIQLSLDGEDVGELPFQVVQVGPESIA